MMESTRAWSRADFHTDRYHENGDTESLDMCIPRKLFSSSP